MDQTNECHVNTIATPHQTQASITAATTCWLIQMHSWCSSFILVANTSLQEVEVRGPVTGYETIHVQPDQTARWRNISIGNSAVSTRVQEQNNCPLRFYLGLNLSTRLCKSNFYYFATKCYGHLSIQWTIVHTMSISWTIVHKKQQNAMDNCPLYGQLSIAFCRKIIKIRFTQSRGQIQSQIKS